MNWETKRKITYGTAVAVFLLSVTLFFLRGVLFPDPTCFDRKQNGFEGGVDCGGVCSRLCTSEVIPLTVEFAKALPNGDDTYDFVAMITNNNASNASYFVSYTLSCYDEKGAVFATLIGSTTIPVDGKIPVILQGVPLKKAPKMVTVSLTDTDHYKVNETLAIKVVQIVQERFEQGNPSRVYATVQNNTQSEINNLPIRTVLFDDQGNAYAVGETLLPLLGKEERKEIVFVWNGKLPFPPSKIGVYPIVNPFSGNK